jgi:hypothetical protein
MVLGMGHAFLAELEAPRSDRRAILQIWTAELCSALSSKLQGVTAQNMVFNARSHWGTVIGFRQTCRETRAHAVLFASLMRIDPATHQ